MHFILCFTDVTFTELTFDSYLDLKVSLPTKSEKVPTHRDDYKWGFGNLCINQTHLITKNPTPSPTSPPTMVLEECNHFLTRLSDWDLLYDPEKTEFVAHGLDYIQFSSIAASDWLFAIDTNLFFPTASFLNETKPIWLDIEMNGFRSITQSSDSVIQPIMFCHLQRSFYSCLTHFCV